MRNLFTHPVDILFLGSNWQSVEILKTLHRDTRFNIVGVITTVDKPFGRKQILTPSLVKEYARKNSIEVFHTEKDSRKYREALDIFKPELIVCVAFGEILPEFFINYPKYSSVNVHFSILPKYRGAVPIQKAILEGEKETGISIMLMSEKLDEGDLLKILKEPILKSDTNLSLREKLVNRTSHILGNTLEEWIKGEIVPVKQESSKATYCWQRDISKKNAEIDWDKMQPEYIERTVRAMIPWPNAWTALKNNREEGIEGITLQILEAELINCNTKLKPGTLFVNSNQLLFSTNNSKICLRTKKLKVAGRKEMTEQSFLNGTGRRLAT